MLRFKDITADEGLNRAYHATTKAAGTVFFVTVIYTLFTVGWSTSTFLIVGYLVIGLFLVPMAVVIPLFWLRANLKYLSIFIDLGTHVLVWYIARQGSLYLASFQF